MITDLEHRVFEQVGVVKAIYRYPVKSMGGERLGSAALRSSGIDGDRQYAFRRQNDASRFPWFTGRDLPPLVTYSARLLDTDNPRQAAARVSGPDGEWTIDDVELRYRLSDASGEPLQLLRVERGAFDNLPVSVLSTATLGMIEARHGRRLDERRFRANIVIESTVGGDAGRETNWVGGILTLGDRPHAASLRAHMPIDRCMMITIDPDSGARDPTILRCVVDDFANEIGVCCSTEVAGPVAVGHVVKLMRS